MSADVRLVTVAGPGIGHGHAMRVLALTEAAWPRGLTLELEVDGSTLSPRERERAAAVGLPFIHPGAAPAAGTVVVIDCPDPTRAVGPYAANPRVVFDDVDRFTGRADLVIQPSAERWLGSGEAKRVLAGYRWVPIGRVWRERIGLSRRATSDRRRPRPKVLVCFGGSDPHAVTARLGPVVAADPGWSTTIVVGPGYEGPRPRGADIHADPADLPDLVAEADVALISAGTIKFEVAALGRAALLVGVADDQRDVGPAFAATGAARWIGDGRTLDPGRVRDAVAGLLADAAGREAMGRAARSVIDGRGGDRLAAEIAMLRG